MDGEGHGAIRHPQRTSQFQPIPIHRDRRRSAAGQSRCVATSKDQFKIFATLPHGQKAALLHHKRQAVLQTVRCPSAYQAMPKFVTKQRH
ncbi:hypothetical protein IX39_08660 [Chryseobacterium formosense]|uniref:Uncharacterized protein n=1 Tax=Chryseobacterium formosense TaxID=236814 RepID=A0A085Z8C2_9FLAO|nr:hypothetical protein IX39_08660 [Chryseobacterium formosense]